MLVQLREIKTKQNIQSMLCGRNNEEILYGFISHWSWNSGSQQGYSAPQRAFLKLAVVILVIVEGKASI